METKFLHPISVCIIAKDEEARIGKCLASIKPYGFEIIVVDTGSADRTKEIASQYADKVLDYAWCDDFSAARNYSLQAASNNWIFMMDCDEWIKTIDVEELNYFRKHHADSVGAISRENLITQNGQYVLNNTDHTERFFNRKLYHYTGIIHEQLTPIRGKDFPCLLLHTTIEHTGYDMTEEQRIAKGQRNLTLLHKQLEQEPENPYVYYQLGKGYEIVQDYASACEYYGKGLYFDVDPSLAYVQAMVVSYGNTLLLTGQAETALGFEQIYDTFAVNADFVYLMGRIYMANERYPQAIEQFYKATTYDTCKFNGANSFLAYYHIALICEKVGDNDNALAYYRECGDYPPAIEGINRLSRMTTDTVKDAESLAAKPSASDAHSKKRIVLFGSDIFILQYIMEQYQRAFQNMGFDTFVFPDTTVKEEFNAATERLFSFHTQGIDAVLTFNNYGYTMRTDKGKSIWDLWNVPCFDLLFDHPMCYHDPLDKSPVNGIVICEDRTHLKYIKRFCPAVRNAFFIPAGGEELHPGEPHTPVKDRSINVLFVGSFKYISDYIADSFDELLTDYSFRHINMPFEQAVEDCLQSIKPDVSDTEIRYMAARYRVSNLNLAAICRMKIIQTLVDAGIRVTVYGGGWKDSPLYGHPLFDLRADMIPFEDSLRLMEDSKIVLNQLTWFRDGCSERIFNTMLQGAVCLTDDSFYLREQFTDGEDLVFYSMQELNRLPQIVKDLLEDPDRMQRIADSGYRAAKSGHTWAHSAEELLRLL